MIDECISFGPSGNLLREEDMACDVQTRPQGLSAQDKYEKRVKQDSDFLSR